MPKAKKVNDKKVMVVMPEYLHKELKMKSVETYKSMNLLIIEALQDYLS